MVEEYYSALGLTPAASEDDVKQAFYKLAKQFHPDRHVGDEESVRRFKKINEAYTALKNRYIRYHEELGVTHESSKAEIRTGYHRARMKYEQALRDGDEEAADHLVFIKEAYEKLRGAPDSGNADEW